MGTWGVFSWAGHFIFVLSIFPSFGGIPLWRNPHTLCLRALRFLIRSGLFVRGRYAVPAEHVVFWVTVQSPWLAGILRTRGSPPARDIREAGLWCRRPRKTSNKSPHSFFPNRMCKTVIPPCLAQSKEEAILLRTSCLLQKHLWIFPRSAVVAPGTSLWCPQHPPSPRMFGGVWDQKTWWPKSLLQHHCKAHLHVDQRVPHELCVHLQGLSGAALGSASWHFSLWVGQCC